MEQPLIIEPRHSATSCVIWLHGLGASKYDFQDVAQILTQSLPHTRFVLPQAPVRPVTINGGMAMPSWYDIQALTNERAVNVADIEASAAYVVSLIEQQQQQGIASGQIVLAGFSQGGAIVYHTAIHSFAAELAGVLALSTYGPTLDDDLQLTELRQQTPFLVLHGSNDNVVLPAMGRLAFERLRLAGADVSWHEYPMQHQFCQEELVRVQQWLGQLFSPATAP